MIRYQLLACGALMGASLLSAQTSIPWEQASRAMREVSTVGSALVLIDDGVIIKEQFAGFADQINGRLVDRNTIWHWGSITKTLTAVAVMQLDHDLGVSESGTRWIDQSAVSLVPELKRIYAGDFDINRVTLRTLLSHSSGMQDGTWPWTDGEGWQPFEPTEWSQLVAMMPYSRLHFFPGSKYSYSNPGFIYLARAMQAVTGDPWQGRIHKSFLMPLGMTASYFGITPVHLRSHRSHNYSISSDVVGDHGADFDPGITIPNGGWNAPVTDLARWLGFLGGSSDSVQQRKYDALVPRATLEEMWRPVVRVDDETEMGLSFFIRTDGENRLVGHTGTQANFRSFFWLDPDSHRAILGVINTSNLNDPDGPAAGIAKVIEAARLVLESGS